MISSAHDQYLLNRCYKIASVAFKQGEVPVGAILTLQGKIIAESSNASRQQCDPSGHAEILVMRRAGILFGNYRMPNTTLYTTLEPCPMCQQVLLEARIGRVVFSVLDTSRTTPLQAPNVTYHPDIKAKVLIDHYFSINR